MKTKLKIIFLFGSLSILFSMCNSDDDFEKGIFPTTPVNFEAVNSVYDDYNSASPFELYFEFPFVFSSNRESQGGNFDLVNYIAYYHYSSSSNLFYIDVYDGSYLFFDAAIVNINTQYNELGPMVIMAPDYKNKLFLFASNRSGDLDIYYLKIIIDEETWDSPILFNKVNSGSDDAYPTFNQAMTEIYFCSDSSGNFDIYNVNIPSSTDLISWIESDQSVTWESSSVLNSSADDKCPYIVGDLMVFTSNKSGGYGGYDLYYSKLKNNLWTTPVNFGPAINSEYDEYRPITMYDNNYENDLMIFSSNRPGGKGGFDLYYVGIPKMIN